MQRQPMTIERNCRTLSRAATTINNADGAVFEFGADGTLLLPIGMGQWWQNREYIGKLFCSYTA